MKKYNLEVNKKQAETISLALDVLARLEAGQLDIVFDMIPWKYYENLNSNKQILKSLQLALTGMQNGNLGIGNVSETAKIAYDLHQVIRNRLAWDRCPEGQITIDFDTPLQWSKQTLAKIQSITVR